VVAATHPAAILRAPDDAGRRRMRHAMVENLRLAQSLLDA
jgi:hypothetical protein